jgi:hypothetical protein
LSPGDREYGGVDPVPEIARFLTERGYTSETPRLGATLLFLKRGHSAGPFLPYVDYLFVHEIDGAGDPEVIARLHSDAQAYGESCFRLPRALRYRIPNVVTLGVSQTPASDAIVAIVTAARRRSVWGGAKDSMYLLDVPGRRLYSAGLEQNPSPHGGSNTSSINPTNRVFRMLMEFSAEYFGQ